MATTQGQQRQRSQGQQRPQTGAQAAQDGEEEQPQQHWFLFSADVQYLFPLALADVPEVQKKLRERGLANKINAVIEAAMIKVAQEMLPDLIGDDYDREGGPISQGTGLRLGIVKEPDEPTTFYTSGEAIPVRERDQTQQDRSMTA